MGYSTIKEVLESLPDKDQRKLMYAFESGIAQYIEFGNSQFIGVYVNAVPNLLPRLKAGDWTVGSIKRY